MTKGSRSYRLFLEVDLFPHTTSQASCYSWWIGVQVILYYSIYTVIVGREKSSDPCYTLFWWNELILLVRTIVNHFYLVSFMIFFLYIEWSILQVYVCSVNPLLYSEGRAWKRSTSGERRQLQETLLSQMNYLSMVNTVRVHCKFPL